AAMPTRYFLLFTVLPSSVVDGAGMVPVVVLVFVRAARELLEPLCKPVVGGVPTHLALEVPEGGLLVDHEELGARDLGEVTEHIDADRGRHDRVMGGAGREPRGSSAREVGRGH